MKIYENRQNQRKSIRINEILQESTKINEKQWNINETEEPRVAKIEIVTVRNRAAFEYDFKLAGNPRQWDQIKHVKQSHIR